MGLKKKDKFVWTAAHYAKACELSPTHTYAQMAQWFRENEPGAEKVSASAVQNMVQRRREPGETRLNLLGPKAAFSQEHQAVIKAALDLGKSYTEVSYALEEACGRTISGVALQRMIIRNGWPRPKYQGYWNEKRLERVKAWWKEGKSAGEIAKILSHEDRRNVTRDAVLGIWSRNGLSGSRAEKTSARTKPSKPRSVVPTSTSSDVKPQKAQKTKGAGPAGFVLRPNFAAAVAPTPVVERDAFKGQVSLLALETGQCKRIEGFPNSESLYCGRPCDPKPTWACRPGDYPFESYCPDCRVDMGYPRQRIQPQASKAEKARRIA